MFQKGCFLVFFLFLCFSVHLSFGQEPAWQGGYPLLRTEAGGFGIRVNLDVQSTIYYVVYDADPSSLTITSNDVKNSGNSIGSIVTSGSFTYGDGTYRINAPPAPAIAGTPGAERVYSLVELNSGTDGISYWVYIVAEKISGTDLQASPILLGPVVSQPASCFRVGTASTDPIKAQSIGTITPKTCSPFEFAWLVSFTGVDYRRQSDVRVEFDLDDGDGVQIIYCNLKDPSEKNKAFQEWESSLTGTYNYDAGDTPGSRVDFGGTTGQGCTFNPRARLRVLNISSGICANTVIGFEQPVWDELDNTDLGVHAADSDPSTPDPDLGTPYHDLCEGDRSVVLFEDVSDFNCTIAENVDANKNYQERWVQWVYGTSTNVTAGAATDEKVTINGNDYDLSDLPIYGPIEYFPSADPFAANSQTLDMQMPSTALVGEFFEVTLRSWNTCNAYDDDVSDGDGLNPLAFNDDASRGGPFPVGPNGSGTWEMTAVPVPFTDANAAPVTTTRNIQIIDSPPPPIGSDQDFCLNDAISLSVTPNSGSNTITWYDKDPSVDPSAVVLHTGTSYNVPNGVIDPSSASQTSLYVTESVVGVVVCESEPLEMVVTVREDLAQPGVITGTSPICNNTSVGFSVSSAAGSTTFGGAAEYQWNSTGGGGVSFNTTTGKNVTVDFNIGGSFTSFTRTIRVRRIYSSNPTCPSPYRTFTVTIFGETQGGTTSTDNTICEGENTGTITLSGHIGTILNWERQVNGSGYVDIGNNGNTTFDENLVAKGTYEYRAVIDNGPCNTETSSVTTIEVNPIPSKPVISEVGDGLIICEDGSNQTILQSTNSGGDADEYIWYDNLFNVVQGPSTSNQLVLNTVGESDTYYVRTLGINPTDCESQLSDPIDVIINPLPTASVSGGGSVCDGGTNPAPDIVWTLSGTAPYDFSITQPAAAGPTIVETGYSGSTYTITAPTDGGNYEMISLTDNNSCSATSLGGPVAVNIIGTASPSIESFTPDPPVCDDGASTTAPGLTLDLAPNSVQDYEITFKIIDGGANLIGTNTISVKTDAAGITSIPIDYTADLDEIPDTYEIRITSIVNITTLCNASGLPSSQFITINPRPADPTNPVDAIACSSDPTGATLSVDDPGVGNIIVWYEDSGLSTLAAGSTSGTGGRQYEFTPTSNATHTYYAVTQSTTTPTLCESENSVSVQHTQDLAPDPAIADSDGDPTQLETCNGDFTLEADAATNGGNGTWSAPGLLYYEDFQNASDGDVSDNDLYGWSVFTNLGTTFDANTHFEVRNNVFEAQDLDQQNNDWLSNEFDITGLTAVDIMVNVSEGGTLEAADFVQLYYMTGGPNVYGSVLNGSFGSGTLSELNVDVTGKTTMRIGVRMNNDQPGEQLRINNVIVRETGSDPITFDNINDPNTTVHGLPQDTTDPFVPVTTTLTWTVTSALQVCNSTSDDVDVTVNPLPQVTDPLPELCEDLPQSSDKVVGVDLTTYKADIVTPADPTHRDVEFYTDNTYSTQITAPVDVSDGDVFYTRVYDTFTSVNTSCFDDGTLTFTVHTLPDAIDQDSTNSLTVFCEQTVGSADKDDIDLTTLNDDVTGIVGSTNRTIEWFFDPGGAVTSRADLTGSEIVSPADQDVDNVTNGDIFYAIVVDNTTLCEDIAQVEITINPRPQDNAIQAPDGSTPGSVTVCKSGSVLFFQIDPALNSGSIYHWTVPPQLTLVGGGTVNDFFVLIKAENTVAAPGVTISVYEESADACDGDINEIDVIVDDAPPAPTITGDQEVCDNQSNVTYSITSPTVGSTYTWNIGNIGSIVSGQGTSSIIVNIGTTSDNITVVEKNATGCTSPPAAAYPVTVNPRPNVTSATTLDLCSGEQVDTYLTFTADIAGTSYDWVVLSKTGSVGGATVGNTGTSNINQTLTNTSGAPGSVTYEVTPTGPAPANCVGPTQVVTVTVESEPVGVNDSRTICSDAAINYDIQSDNIGPLGNNLSSEFTYVVSSSDEANVPTPAALDRTVQSNVPITDVFTNTTPNQVTITYTITPIETASGNDCTGSTFDVEFKINPEPLFTGTLDATVCSDENTGVVLPGTDDDGDAISSYDISAAVGAGLTGTATTATGSANVNAILNDSFTNLTSASIDVVYTITPYRNTCAGSDFTITVTVDPEPVFTGTLDGTICSGDAIGVTLPATDDDGDGITTYDVSAVVGAGLTGAATTATGTAATNLISGDIFTNVTNASADVVYTVTPYIGTCAGDDFTITVTIDPEPVFTGNLNTAVCSDEVTGIVLPATDDDGDGITSYDVSAVVGAGLTGTAATATGTTDINLIASDAFNNVGNGSSNVVYTITPYIGTCDGTAFDITITVNPEPVFTGNLDATVCSDDITGVVLPATDDDGDGITSYDISAAVGAGLTGTATTATGSGNVNAILNDVFTNTTSASIDVVYTITPYSNTCVGSDFTITVTVDPEPVYTGNLDATICSGDAIGVTLPGTDDDGDGIDSYDVSAVVGAGLTGTATTATGTTATNLIAGDIFTNVTNASADVVYTVTPYIGTCAGDNFTITLTISPEPVFTGNLNTTVCSDEVTGVVLPGTDDDGDAITSYDVSASVGAGLTGTATTATGTTDINLIASDAFNNVGNASADVTYTITPYIGSCDGTPFTIKVTVNFEPVFTGNLDATVCSDDITGVVLPATDDDGDGITSYDISAAVGAGLTGTATTVTGSSNVNAILNDTFTNTTSASIDVVYTITPYRNTCVGSDFIITVTVDPEPVYTGDLDATICSGDAIGVTLPGTDDDSDGIDSYDVSAVVGAGLTGTATTATGTTATNLIVGDVFSNVTNASADVVYTVTPYIGTCAGTNFTITTTIDPEPVYTTNLDVTICSDENTGVIIPNIDDDGGTITKFDVSAVVGAGLTGTASTGTNQANVNLISGDSFENLTNSPIDVVYTITPYFGICDGADIIVTVTVNPEPVFTGDLDVTICSDDVTGVILPATDDDGNGITSYDVSAAVGVGLTGIPTTATGTTNINLIANNTFNNVQSTSADVIYTITPYIGACQGANFTITVTVNPEPVYTGNLNTTVCSDEISGIVLPANDNSGDAISSYDITAAVGGVLTGTASTGTGITDVNEIFNDSFTNLSNNTSNVVYTVTPYIGSCAGSDFNITLAVSPEPVFTGNLDVTVCSDDVTGVTLPGADDDGDAINSYDITAVVGAGLTGTASTGTGVTNTSFISADQFNNVTSAPIDVVYTIKPYRSGCDGTDFIITVTVDPEPVYTGNLDVTVCSDNAIGVVLPATDNSGDAIDSYDVTAVVGSNLTGTPTTATGTTNVNLIAADVFNNVSSSSDIVTYTITPYIGSCPGTPFDIQVTVDEEPLFTGDLDVTVCSDEITGVILPATDDDGNTITTFDVAAVVGAGLTGSASTGPGISNLNYITNDVFNNSTNSTVDVVYTLTPYIGLCQGTDFDITVTVKPEPVFTGNLDVTVCSDQNIGVTIPATDDDGGAITSFNISAVVSGGLIGTATTGTGLSAVNSILNDTFTNPTTAPLAVDYAITPFTNGCVGTTFNITATIDPEPVFTGVLDQTICSDDIVGVTLPGTDDSGDVIDSYDVTAVVNPNLTGAASTATGTTDVNLISSDTYNNVTNQAEEVVYTVTPYIGICPGNAFDIVITVNPEPVFTAVLDNTVCSDEITNVTLPTADDDGRVIDSYDVSAVVGGGLTGTASAAVGTGNRSLIKNDVFTNTTNADEFVVYTVTPYFGTCPGDDFVITVTINPEPVLDAGLSPAPVCSGIPSGITLVEEDTPPSTPAVAFDINSITMGPDLIAGGSNAGIGPNQAPNALANDVFTNTSNGDRIVTYNVTPIAATGCKGDPVNVIFTIKAAPKLADLDVIVCSDDPSGTNITLGTQVTSAAADTYDILDIRVDGALVANGGNVATANGIADVNYIKNDSWINNTNDPLTVEYDIRPVTAAPDLCQGPITTVVVTVEPEVTVIDPADENICSGGTTNINITSPTNPTSGNVTFNVTSTSTSGLVTGRSVFLQLSNPSTINDVIVNNSDAPQTVTYTITPLANSAKNGSGCSGGTPQTVDVVIEPKPKLDTSVPTFETVCENDPLAITLASPTTLTSGSVEFEVENVTATGSVTGFSTIGTIFNAGDILSDVLSNPTSSNQTVTYELRPRATGTPAGSCDGDLATITITVTPRPVVTPAETDIRICSGDFINVALPTDVANSIAKWTVSSNTNVQGQFDGLGSSLFQALINNSSVPQTLTYTVEPFLLLDNSCAGPSVDVTVTVDPLPNVNIVDNQLTVCSGDVLNIPLNGDTPNTTFEVTASTTNTNISGYADFTGTNGDVLSQTITHSGTSPGTIIYTVTPRFTEPTPGVDVCSGVPDVVIVTVSPPVSGEITTTDETLCKGTTKAIEFKMAGAAPFTLTLDNGAGTPSFQINNLANTHVILSTETETYRLLKVEDFNGCSVSGSPIDEVTTTFKEAIADFTINGSKTPDDVTLDFNTGTVTVDIVINNYNPANDYDLTIGEDVIPVTGPNLTYTFNEPSPAGTLGYLAELRTDAPGTTNPCNDIENFFIKVLPADPTVVARADIQEGCMPLTVKFESYYNDLSLSKNVVPTTLTWDFDDGQSPLTDTNPTKTFTAPGVYRVTVTGNNGYPGIENEATDVLEVIVYEKPSAIFQVVQEVVYIPDDALKPINRSRGANQFEWDFGDGTDIDTDASPQHIYEQPGTYTVTLTATNADGCTDEFSVDVNVEEGGFTKTPNAFTPSLSGPSSGLGGGTGGSGSALNDVFLPITEGVVDFHMLIFDRWGNLVFESNDKQVGWDGYNSKGKLLPAGVYVYKLELTLSNGQRTTRVGDVTLIR